MFQTYKAINKTRPLPYPTMLCPKCLGGGWTKENNLNIKTTCIECLGEGRLPTEKVRQILQTPQSDTMQGAIGRLWSVVLLLADEDDGSRNLTDQVSLALNEAFRNGMRYGRASNGT